MFFMVLLARCRIQPRNSRSWWTRRRSLSLIPLCLSWIHVTTALDWTYFLCWTPCSTLLTLRSKKCWTFCREYFLLSRVVWLVQRIYPRLNHNHSEYGFDFYIFNSGCGFNNWWFPWSHGARFLLAKHWYRARVHSFLTTSLHCFSISKSIINLKFNVFSWYRSIGALSKTTVVE